MTALEHAIAKLRRTAAHEPAYPVLRDLTALTAIQAQAVLDELERLKAQNMQLYWRALLAEDPLPKEGGR